MTDIRSYQFFEAWARNLGMTYLEKVESRDATYLLADSNHPVEHRDTDSGVVTMSYVTAYCISREGGNWIASSQPNDPLDYFGDSVETGRRKRLDEALKYAKERHKLTAEQGLYHD